MAESSAIRVCHVAPLARGYVGGPLVSVTGLCRALVHDRVDTTLLCLDLPKELADGVSVQNFQRWEAPFVKELSISPALRDATYRAAGWADVLHVHGMWQMPCIYPAGAVRKTGCRLIASPRGSLSQVALARSRVRKSLAWWLAQRRLFERAACIHATSDQEAEDIRRAGVTAPIAVIPNGVTVLPPDRRPSARQRTFLYLGRLHPIKGLDILLRAWALVQDRIDGQLMIVGKDEVNYRAQMETLIRAHGLKRVSIRNSVSGEAKDALIQQASVLVLPSHSENFGMAVAEALAAGVPVAASRGTPWRGLVEQGCGWWVTNDVQSWADVLAAAALLPERTINEMGDRGRRWVENQFSWKQIAIAMNATYMWVLGRGPKPACVVQNR